MCLNGLVTKYHAVRDLLLDRLETMAPGDQFPPERDLAQEIGVSRMTLRRAIDELVAQGAVRRRHGSGVFATGPKLDQALAASSFTEDMRARGLKPGAHTLEFEVSPAGTRVQRQLQLSEGEEIVAVRRLRLADDEPIALEELHVPRRLLPSLRADDLENQSFYELLHQHGIEISSSVQTIEPTVVEAEGARHLGVPVHTPALLFERTSRSAQGTPIEFVRSVYRGDRYKIRTELTMPAPHTPQPVSGKARQKP